MGRKKINIAKIKDERLRQVTYCKRKKGLLKKAIELSLLCGVKVFLFLHDKEETKVLQYQSHPEEDLRILFKRNINREFVSNADYERIIAKRGQKPPKINAIENTQSEEESKKEDYSEDEEADDDASIKKDV